MIPILENVPLAPFTSLQIGGAARFLATVRSTPELRQALLFARSKGVSFAILGGGTNLLVSDGGFAGLVVRLKMEEVTLSGSCLEAGAGADLAGVVQLAAGCGLSGLEPLAGIPGLVGGAVRGNAGAYGSCIGELAATVSALDSETLELIELGREECAFAYRNSRFKQDPRLVVVSARLALSAGEPEGIRERVEATLAKRSAKRLQCEKSVGSFFMNPVVADQELIRRFETDQGSRCRESRIPAGWLIDRAGLRNARVGAAMVSSQHANYLINTGAASAQEMVLLARLVQSRVHSEMGVRLQEEVSRLGFTPPP